MSVGIVLQSLEVPVVRQAERLLGVTPSPSRFQDPIPRVTLETVKVLRSLIYGCHPDQKMVQDMVLA